MHLIDIIIPLIISAGLGILFLFLNKRRQNIWRTEKKWTPWSDNKMTRILDFTWRNIFGILAFIFLFGAISIIFALI
ncbi:hypothetical protein ASO20_01055 [Mycoplasma sp. (ex Biomphalaria glabrata)]|nr:hypothetical protein ASO20_01055 [Mycoplasma sp. (ex Biomphalaria glabrata)]